MQTPTITLSPAQWQQAIHESWLLCPDDACQLTIQTAIDSCDYLYFSAMRHGTAHQNNKLETVLAKVNPHNCWCFYQEAGQKPALEACLFIPHATQCRSLQKWTELIFDLNQEAFVSGTATNHHVWQKKPGENHYKSSVLSTAPRAITFLNLRCLIKP